MQTETQATIPWYERGNLEPQMWMLLDGKPRMPHETVRPEHKPRPDLYEELLRIITPFVDNTTENQMAVVIMGGTYHPRRTKDWTTDIYVLEGTPVTLEALRWLLDDVGRAAQLVYALGYQVIITPLIDASRQRHGIEEVYLLEKRPVSSY